MTFILLFAFLSGIITILSPCILPVLPVVLSGGVSGGKARPFGVVTGFVIGFTVFTLTLTAIVQTLGIPSDALRLLAVIILIIFGLIMIIPALKDRFTMLLTGLANIGSRMNSKTAGNSGKGNGFWSGIPVGLSLGLVWTPCVGPIMASVMALALTQNVNGSSVLITLFYTLGTAVPMLSVMLGGRELLKRVPWLSRNSENIQKVFGVLMILTGITIGAGWDRSFQTMVLRAFPNYGSGLTAIENNKLVKNALRGALPGGSTAMQALPGAVLSNNPAGNEKVFRGIPDNVEPDISLPDYGLAPEIIPGGTWFNSSDLTMQSLRGKVVVVDFWTYSCINCIRTLPYIRAWYDAYKDKGLVIIGMHTPEFEFEKKTENVASAVKDLKVNWPVVQDNGYLNWNSFHNQYWPADYFIDAKGHVRYFHFGEGDYENGEKVIQSLLKEKGEQVSGIVSKPMYDISANTPETYLGYTRGSGFVSKPAPARDKPVVYTPIRSPGDGEWTLQGNWIIAGEYIEPQADGTLEFSFNARNVFLVITPLEPGASIKVSTDGSAGPDTPDVKSGVLNIRESRLYQLEGLKTPGSHKLRLETKGKIRLFAFTFG